MKTSEVKICPRKEAGYKSGEGLKYCVAAHAEANAIAQAARQGVMIDQSLIYVRGGVPCKNCSVLIVNAGIQSVFCFSDTPSYDEVGEEMDNLIPAM